MRLAIIAINVAVITGIASLLTGCGLTQTVSESTVSLTKSIFYKEIKTLHLDFLAREAVNKNAQGIALSTVVRIYQLKDRKAFDSANYQSLFAEDSTVVKADLVAQKISESVRGKRYARYSIRNRSTIYRCSRHVYFPRTI